MRKTEPNGLEATHLLGKWYDDNVDVYEALGKVSSNIISSILEVKAIEFLSVTHRTKSKAGFCEKKSRKEYSSAAEMTDICGVRVIGYIETDLEKISDCVREAFSVDAENSMDKSIILSDNLMGYRSIHLVCELSRERLLLPEHHRFVGLKLEVQIRTVLQHAWAEIEHDRKYKFASALPAVIRRRLNLLAGVLELADREFGLIAAEVDIYQVSLAKSVEEGGLDKEELTTLSLLEFVKTFDAFKVQLPSEKGIHRVEEVIEELKRFGIADIEGVRRLLTAEYVEEVKKSGSESFTTSGLMRRAMMYADVDKYFLLAWGHRWQIMRPETFKILSARYEKKVLEAKLKKYGVRRSSQATKVASPSADIMSKPSSLHEQLEPSDVPSPIAPWPMSHDALPSPSRSVT